jgi:hypothetical protein
MLAPTVVYWSCLVSRDRGIEPRAAEYSNVRVSDVSHYTIPDVIVELGRGSGLLRWVESRAGEVGLVRQVCEEVRQDGLQVDVVHEMKSSDQIYLCLFG